MQQYGMQQMEPEEKVKHNIFSSQNYGIGRLEFLGANILIYNVLMAVCCVLVWIFRVLGIDIISARIIVNIIGVILLTYLCTMNYAHRMYHIGWTDELNSRSIGFLVAILTCVGSIIPLLKLFFGLIAIIWLIILLIVPGCNE